ncbi:MAG: hypothetical protein Q7U92_03390 [Bradyrhizobium sp.]|nr:hypothetical protein [Bradyrhizobium sp.]
MAISSIWTEPEGFSTGDASAAASGSPAAAACDTRLEAVGAAFAGAGAATEGAEGLPAFAEAGLSVDGPGMACVLLAATSPQREPTTDVCAPGSSAFGRGSLSGLIAPTVASGRGAVKTLVSGATRDGGSGHSARALVTEDGALALALSGGEAGSAAGGEVFGAVRETFSLASPMYQQARLVARSTR